MFKFFKKISVIGTIIAVILFTTVMAIAIPVAQNKDDYSNLAVKSFTAPTWTVSGENGQAVETTNLYTYLRFNVSDLGDNKLKAVWFNFGESAVEALNLSVGSFSSTTSSGNSVYGFGKKDLDLTTIPTNQWVCVSSNYKAETVGKGPDFTVSFDKNIVINEIVFVGITPKGALVKLNPVLVEVGAIAGDKLTNPLTGSVSTRNAMPSLLDEAMAVVDEQGSFDLSLVERTVNEAGTGNYAAMNAKEVYAYPEVELTWLQEQRLAYYKDVLTLKTTGAQNNTLSGKTGALGLEVIYLGVAMFGETAFGMQSMALVFGIASIILLAFLLKKHVKDGLIFACVSVAFAGVLSVFTVALGVIVAPIVALFIVGAVFFALNYIAKTLDAKMAINVVISGLLLSVAIALKSTAIVVLPFIVAGIVYRAIKDCKVLKVNGKSAKSYIVDLSVSAVIGFVFMAFIVLGFSNLIISKTLFAVTGEKSLLTNAFKTFGKSFVNWL